jgi:hypothetical protein
MAEGRPRTSKADETPVPGFKYHYVNPYLVVPALMIQNAQLTAPSQRPHLPS